MGGRIGQGFDRVEECVLMPLLSYQGRQIFYAHCPKAGGTSVEEFLLQYGVLAYYDRNWFGRRQKNLMDEGHFPCSPQHLIWADFLKLHGSIPDVVFTVVRNPMSRLVSEYKFQRRYRPALKWVYRCGFSVWLRAMLRLQKKHKYLADNHFRPQTEFAPEWSVVFRLEDGMGSVEAFLTGVLGSLEMGEGIGHSQVTPVEQNKKTSYSQQFKIIIWCRDFMLRIMHALTMHLLTSKMCHQIRFLL